MTEKKKIPTYELDGKPLLLIEETNEVCVISKAKQGGEWLEVRRLMCMSCTSDLPYTRLKPIDRELTSPEWEIFSSYPGARAYIPAPLPIPNLYQKPLSKKILHLFQSLVGLAVLGLFSVFLWNVIDFKLLGCILLVLCGMAFGVWGMYGLIKRGL